MKTGIKLVQANYSQNISVTIIWVFYMLDIKIEICGTRKQVLYIEIDICSMSTF